MLFLKDLPLKFLQHLRVTESANNTNEGEKMKLLIDTDIGSDIDDALCLAYLLKQPLCEIVGITTCSSEPEKRAEIVDSICRYSGREIPIYPGLSEPLVGKQLQVAVHQYDVTKSLPHKTNFPCNEAIDFMRRTIEANPHEIVLLPIGPLTNIGALFAAYPHLIPLVKEVSYMGGSFFEDGLSFLTSEWNIKNDPIAAKILFDSKIKLTVSGLDVTLKLLTSCKEFLDTPCADVLKPVKLYAQKFLERTNDMYFHDALAAVLLFCDDICEYKYGSIDVDLGHEWGRTYFNEDKNGTTRVTHSINVEKFFKHYYDIINL